MDAVHLVVTLLLGGVLVLSAVTKFVAPEEWRTQARGFGAPSPVVAALPFAELVVGALTMTQVADPIPSWIALGLLVAFTLAIVVNLAGGRRPPCACFGSLSAKPISWRHVARNAALVGLAVTAIATA